MIWYIETYWKYSYTAWMLANSHKNKVEIFYWKFQNFITHNFILQILFFKTILRTHEKMNKLTKLDTSHIFTGCFLSFHHTSWRYYIPKAIWRLLRKKRNWNTSYVSVCKIKWFRKDYRIWLKIECYRKEKKITFSSYTCQ